MLILPIRSVLHQLTIAVLFTAITCGISSAQAPALMTAKSTVDGGAVNARGETSYLSIASGDRITILEPGQVTYTFGDVSVISSAPITRDFILHNGTKAALDISRIQTSCRCTTAFVGTGSAAKLPIQVAAGADITLHVSIDPARLYPGAVKKFIWVCGNNGGEVDNIEMVGNLRAAVTFDPPTLDFGRVRTGESHPVRVTVHVDPQLASTPMHLASSQQGLVITPISGPDAKPSSSQATGTPTDPTTWVYLIDLAKASPLGSLSGTIAMVPERPTKGSMSSLTGAWIRTSGSVYGDIIAVPETIDFGSGQPGDLPTTKVMFSGPGISPTNLKATADTRYFTTRFVDAGASPDGSANKVELDITGTNGLPIGRLQSQITVTTPKGERYVLPTVVTTAKAMAPTAPVASAAK